MTKKKVVSGTRSCWIWIIIGLTIAVVLVFGGLIFLVGPMIRGQMEASQHYAACTAFLSGGDCDQAATECEAVVRLDAFLYYPDATTLLAQARDCQKEMHYQRGLAAMDAGEWPMAVEELRKVFEIDPTYKQVGAKLQEAKDQMAVAGITPTPLPAPAGSMPTYTPTPGPTDTPTATPTPTETPVPPIDTPTPSTTLQPTPVPLSSLRILFQDDFSNIDRGWVADWRDGLLYQGGRVELFTGPAHWLEYNIAYPGSQFQDFILEIDIQNLTDKPSARMGVLLRVDYSSDMRDSRYYLFRIGGDGTVEFIKHRAAFYVDSLLPSTFSPAVDLDGVNRIHIEAQGGEFQFFINDQYVGACKDMDYYAVGDIGLYVGDPNDVGIRVGFDNLAIRLFEK